MRRRRATEAGSGRLGRREPARAARRADAGDSERAGLQLTSAEGIPCETIERAHTESRVREGPSATRFGRTRALCRGARRARRLRSTVERLRGARAGRCCSAPPRRCSPDSSLTITFALSSLARSRSTSPLPTQLSAPRARPTNPNPLEREETPCVRMPADSAMLAAVRDTVVGLPEGQSRGCVHVLPFFPPSPPSFSGLSCGQGVGSSSVWTVGGLSGPARGWLAGRGELARGPFVSARGGWSLAGCRRG